MLTALGKQHELKGHVRGALNNGATVKEIQEVLLHATIYCGVPAAVDAFRTRRRSYRQTKSPGLTGSTWRAHGSGSSPDDSSAPAISLCTRSAVVLALYLRIRRAR